LSLVLNINAGLNGGGYPLSNQFEAAVRSSRC
jgi:hypothetical protein